MIPTGGPSLAQKSVSPARLTLWAIIGIGLAIRLWHLTWSLPDLYEEAYPLRISSQMWQWAKPGLDFNPHFFNYPAFTFYLQFILQAILYGVGHILGIYPNLQAFGNALPASIILGRLTSALFDAGTILVVFLAGKRLDGIETGLIAAAMIAISPLHVSESHLINVDVPLTFFSLLAVYFMLRIRDEGDRKWYFLAGASIGFAIASKYTGAFLIPVLVAAHLLRSPTEEADQHKGSLRDLAGSIVLSGIVFLAWNPFILLSFDEFRRGLSFEQFHMAYGHLGVDTSENGYFYYLFQVLPDGFGWPFAVVALISCILLFVGRNRIAFLLLGFPIILLLVIGSWAMRADRYLLPAMPMLALAGAMGIALLQKRLAMPDSQGRLRVAKPVRSILPYLASAILVIPEAGRVVDYHQSFVLPDTRTVAKEWILKVLPSGSTYVTGPFGIQFPTGMYTSVEIPFSPTGSENLWPFYDARWYEDLDLLIAADYDYGRFIRDPNRFRRVLAYYDSLHARWSLELEIKPAERQQGPTLWMYKFPEAARSERFNAGLLGGLGLIVDTPLVVEFAEHLAFALFTKGKLAKSEQLMELAVSLEPDNTRLLRELAWNSFKSGKFEQAISLLDRSLHLDPVQPEVLGLRGSVYLRMGHPAEAERDLLSAISLNARLEFPYLDLESLYRQVKEKSKLAGIIERHMSILQPGSDAWKRLEEEMNGLRGEAARGAK